MDKVQKPIILSNKIVCVLGRSRGHRLARTNNIRFPTCNVNTALFDSLSASVPQLHCQTDKGCNYILFLAYFLYFEKKIDLCNLHPVCVSVYPHISF
jgi:hypothetical protein